MYDHFTNFYAKWFLCEKWLYIGHIMYTIFRIYHYAQYADSCPLDTIDVCCTMYIVSMNNRFNAKLCLKWRPLDTIGNIA